MHIARIVIALLIAATSVAAQERVVNRELNFSVQSPSSDWKWGHIEGEKLAGCDGIVFVTNPRGEQFSISASPVGKFRLDEDMIYQLRSTIRREASDLGYRVADFQHANSGSPIFPSYTYSYSRIAKDGTVSYVDGYIGAVNRIYTIQYVSNTRGSLDEFKRFVASFQIADKFEALRGATGPVTSPFAGLTGPMHTTLGLPLAPNEMEPIRH